MWARKRQIMSLAASRFANAALYAGWRGWLSKHPPRTRIRKELAPYAERVQTLEEELRTERAAHEVTKSVLQARLHDAEMNGKRRAEGERALRVDHLVRSE